jgi:hypothetical protein
VKLPGLAAAALQFHSNALQIALPPVRGCKAKSHHPLLAISAVEITAIQAELREARCVEVIQIVERVHTVLFLGFSFSELKMKMGIGRVFLTHCADHVALSYVGAWDHTLGEAVEMKIDKEQVILSIRRIGHFENDMGGPEALPRPRFIRRPGSMHYGVRHGMDRRADGSGEVDAVMKVPAISVNPRPEGRIHLVRLGRRAEGPD